MSDRYMYFELPTAQEPVECLRVMADMVSLFVDICKAPDEAGNGDDLKLTFCGARGASTILASIEQGMREVACYIEAQEKKQQRCTCQKGGK
jgi:hypothetical protein